MAAMVVHIIMLLKKKDGQGVEGESQQRSHKPQNRTISELSLTHFLCEICNLMC